MRMLFRHTQKLVYASEILSEISMFKSKKNGYKFALIKISGIMPFNLYHLNEEKIRHFFDVLFVLLPYLDQEISPFF